jgi:hypothetical protein
MLALPFRFFQDFHPATHTPAESLNGSETKAGQSIPMFNYNLFDFTSASCIYDLKN